jgi:flagellar hook-associated protein 1 FlgK
MSSFSTVNTAFTALQAAQSGMLVTSQNVAGANVDGYSRRRAELSLAQFTQNTSSTATTGFTMQGFVRDYSQIIDAQRMSQNGDLKKSQTLVDATTGLDTLLVDKKTSLGPALDSFYASGTALVRNPDDQAARATFLGAAEALVSRVQGMSATLEGIVSYATLDMKSTLEAANRNALELAKVNESIVASAGQPLPDLLDRRDNLLNALHGALGGQSSISPDGTAIFRVSGNGFVDGVSANSLEMNDAGKLIMTVGDGDQAYKQQIDTASVKSGKVGADLELINQFVPEMHAKLNALATELVAGTSLLKTNASGSGLFKFAGPETAGNLTMAITKPAELEIDRAGAAKMSDLQVASSRSWAEFVSSSASTMATWSSDLNANEAVQSQLKTEKERISGVNLDEEAANLLTFQQLYQASSKLMEATSKMFDTLLSVLR